MFGIPRISLASKSSPWATSEAPIDSQTPTECGEIPFPQNELVAPEKKPNQKNENEKKCRDAFLRSSQVRKLLNAGGKPSTKFPPDRLDEKARIQASSSQVGGAKPHVALHKRRVITIVACRPVNATRGAAPACERRSHTSEARSHLSQCTSHASGRA